MQEYGFFSALGKDAERFWEEAIALAEKHGADRILAYMRLMIEKARIGEVKTTREAFVEYGKSIAFFPGVVEWFDRIDAYGTARGVDTEHYIVSSGLKEMIEGTPIKDHFQKIYACSFMYDNNGAAEWPAVAVNYTTKTQFLFRINKGITDDNDNDAVNRYTPEEDRRIPFSRMIYIGDGLTDIPCMTLVKDGGGHAIAVYDPDTGKDEITGELVEHNRVNHLAEADYSEGGDLDSIVKGIIDGLASKGNGGVL